MLYEYARSLVQNFSPSGARLETLGLSHILLRYSYFRTPSFQPTLALYLVYEYSYRRNSHYSCSASELDLDVRPETLGGTVR